MVSESPNASWHPALMPNSISEPAESNPSPAVASLPANDEGNKEQTNNPDAHEHDDRPEEINEGAHVDQFGSEFHDEDTETGAWDLSNPHEGAPLYNKQPTEQPTEQTSTAADYFDLPEEPMTSKAAKHSSTMSFARTVSQEINMDDDDDSELSFQRSNTDPFKFMPPNERSNSFPPVPPFEPAPDSSPLAALVDGIQSEDVDHQDEPEFHPNPAYEDTTTQQAMMNEPDFEQALGGDVIGAEDDSATRFEESLPLIPHAQAEDSANAKPVGFDAFADEADDGADDFFSHIEDNTGRILGGKDRSRQALLRKDTDMFTNLTTQPELISDVEKPSTAEEHNSDAREAGANGATLVQPSTNNGQELDAKWAAAFEGDDDDGFLLGQEGESQEIDPAAFFGSDDEGFLDDDVDAPEPQLDQTTQPAPASHINNRYTPAPSAAQPQFHPQPPQTQPIPNNPYAPSAHPSYASPNTAPPAALAFGAPPVKPAMSKAQSFVDKTKGGYSSPYDLPMDVVQSIQRRPNAQSQPRSQQPQAVPPPSIPVPPRSTSTYGQPPFPSPSANPSGLAPSPTNQPNQPGPPNPRPAPSSRSSSGFFEDLPISSKPRSSSRAPSRQNSLPLSQDSPSASQGPPKGPPPGSSFGPSLMRPEITPPSTSHSSTVGLVVPEKASPYAQLQSAPRPAPPPSNHYSPSNAMPPPSSSANRYSPAPSGIRSQSAAYPPSGFAHQPRTSSPLAHFETSSDGHRNKQPSPVNSEGATLTRSGSLQYEPRMNRVPSLPPTQEVDEEGGAPLQSSPAAMRYSPLQTRRTPPPLTGSPKSNTLSPPKRPISNYAPLPQRENGIVPPPRPLTQSPGLMHNNQSPGKSSDYIPRPSSVQGTTPTMPTMPSANPTVSPPVARSRGISQTMNLVAPTDGREHDMLERWRGAPLIAWGVGGTLITSFPKNIPRYSINSATPSITRGPGEVKVQHVKDVYPLEERLAKFPGPLRGKSKKKETLAWLSTGIQAMEPGLPNPAFSLHSTHEDKRAVERVLLWKVLHVMVEHDGMLEGNPNVEKAVRHALSPELEGQGDEPAHMLMAGADLQSTSNISSAAMVLPGADSVSINEIKKHLLVGEREKAVWAAADKRLWGHAMLVAGTVSSDLYKQVAQEFVKKEVNLNGHNNQSLAALYGVLAGNHEESVDELVPVHARAGLQLMSTSTSAAQSEDALEGLDKWRETLGMILSNRSNEDVKSITSLGNLLAGYGRAEAAHICFIFARKHAVFGGLDDASANFVLVGADHRRQADQFAKDAEALQLSEVYEFALSLSAGTSIPQSCPHLAAYKLHHAMTLAEYGSGDKALQYVESIMAAMHAQTRRSPYYHMTLHSAVEDLMTRLKQAPREESSSWISKPTMGQVSNSMWNRFNKFVAGDETEGSGGRSPVEGSESGPFARVAGGTPTISRSPSMTNLDPYGNANGGAMLNLAAAATKAGSRYAPMSAQNSGSAYEPRASMERTSGEYKRTSYEMSRPSIDQTPSYGYGSYSSNMPSYEYQPTPPAQPTNMPPQPQPGNPYMPPQSSAPDNTRNPYAPTAETQPGLTSNMAEAHGGYQPPSYGYEPPTMPSSDIPTSPHEEPAPSGGYEPPTFQPPNFDSSPYEPNPEDRGHGSESPKKSFMDDNEDTMSVRSNQGKSKTEKDREADEMFRKVAEEDAKRAEAAKANKKGWFGGGWFIGSKKEKEKEAAADMSAKPIRAKLGETNSFIYDPDIKRWINKKSGAENTPAKTATPPPPRAVSRNGMATPPPPMGSTPSAGLGISTPPRPTTSSGLAPALGPGVGLPMRSISGVSAISQTSTDAGGGGGSLAPPMARSGSNMSTASGPEINRPPSVALSRPTTSLSNASSIDDLLGAAGPRKPAAKRGRKGGRYVDVMAK